MASNLLNAKASLLIAPIVSSSCSILFATDFHLFLRALFRAPLKDSEWADAFLTSFWSKDLNSQLFRVLSFLTITSTTSLASVYLHAPLLKQRGSYRWYLAAATFAFVHLAWVPGVMWKIEYMAKDLGKDKGGKRNVEVMQEWMDVNWRRTWTTDMLTWGCTLVAVSKTMTF